MRKRQEPSRDEGAGDDEPIEDHRDDARGVEAYPLNTLLIRSEPRAIADVLRRIHKNAIQLDPDFERDFVWEEARQSRLIESVLMRIPLPVFYLAEDRNGRLIVVDGLQRLTTFKRFRDGELELDLPERPELHEKGFEQLPQSLQDRFEDGPLMFYLIDPSVPDSVRLDIFERVNSGVALSRQQMRNALYNGPATRLLRELAEGDDFLEATGGSLSIARRKRSMGDREAINRFCAYHFLGWEQYGPKPAGLGEFDEFLGVALQRLNDNASALKRTKMAFLRGMKLNQLTFGEHAFRKSKAPGRRSALNLALFDVLSVGLARYDEKRIEGNEPTLRKAFYRLLNNANFNDAITFATSRPDNVHARFEMTERMLERVLGAP